MPPVWPGNPFRHPAWLDAHATVLEPELVVERWGTDPSDQAVTGHVTGGALRMVGDRLSDRLDPPIEALEAALACAAARQQPVRLRHLPTATASALAASTGGEVTETIASPTIALAHGEWDTYLGRPEGRRCRRIAAQAERTLSAADVAVDVADAPETIGPALDRLAALHHQRFGDRSQTFEPAKHACIAAAVAPMATDGAAIVRTLSIGGTPVAAMLLFRGEGAAWFHQSGWDPAFADRSVGRALLVDAMRSACEEHLDFHLLCGEHEYKQWWATHDEPVATLEITRW